MLLYFAFCFCLLFFKLNTAQTLSSSSNNTFICLQDESFALFQLKQSFTTDTLNTTSSWIKGTDCCKWQGISCHSRNRHVISLDLSGSNIIGTIEQNSTLFDLHHLENINLAFNYFSLSPISPKFGQFAFLKHLNLSLAFFSGEVPLEIGQLSHLEILDLSGNSLKMPNSNTILSNMTKLRRLGLGTTTFDDSIVFPSILNLTSLTYLGLHTCELKEEVPFELLNLPSLDHLDIGINSGLYAKFPLSNWSSPLQYLDLIFVNFSSKMPSSPGQAPYQHLRTLRLSNCGLQGSVPSWVWSCPAVDSLVLTNNQFTGVISEFLPNIRSKELSFLDLRSNKFTGNISLYSFYSRLPKLYSLMLSDNALSVTTKPDNLDDRTSLSFTWPLIVILSLSSCNLNEIPYFLKNQIYLSDLDLSKNNIHGEIPRWFLDSGKEIEYIDLSHNFLTGNLELPWTSLWYVDVSYNMFKGSLPIPLSATTIWFSTSNNNFTGPIDSSICNLTSIELLDLSNNSLSGDLPQCLGSLSDELMVLNLRSNHLRGNLPSNISKCANLMYFDLSGNELEGLVPRSLIDCTYLQFLDLEGNNLRDEYPHWLHILPYMQVLNLGSNKFHGTLTLPISTAERDSFPSLRILDISSNSFAGRIPTNYVRSFTAMSNVSVYTGSGPRYMGAPVQNSLRQGYNYSIVLSINGVQRNYERIITTLSSLDLSDNAFEGEIPESIGELVAIQSLNLSHNQLTGSIPASISKLTLLNSLDMSANRLKGEIPQELASLTYLGVFNVSENQLVGQIPHSNNFDTFPENSYEGNRGLCGFPLPQCGRSRPSTSKQDQEDGSRNGEVLNLSPWEVILISYGCGTLLGLVWGYYMLSIGKPFWLTKLAFLFEVNFAGFIQKHKRRNSRIEGRM